MTMRCEKWGDVVQASALVQDAVIAAKYRAYGGHKFTGVQTADEGREIHGGSFRLNKEELFDVLSVLVIWAHNGIFAKRCSKSGDGMLSHTRDFYQFKAEADRLCILARWYIMATQYPSDEFFFFE